jgi:hypothetical protein
MEVNFELRLSSYPARARAKRAFAHHLESSLLIASSNNTHRDCSDTPQRGGLVAVGGAEPTVGVYCNTVQILSPRARSMSG